MMENTTTRFRHFPMEGECRCGSKETMYVGEVIIDEKCCSCGLIIGGGYLKNITGSTEDK